jgi:8-oxo-dGTP diphosphatase
MMHSQQTPRSIALRTRLAHFLRRIPWLMDFLKRIYRLFLPHYTAGAVGFVFNPRGEVLLVEHVLHPRLPWGAPGGWLDPGETPGEAVVREMREEVGLSVEIVDLLHIDFLPTFRHVTFAYLCKTENYEINVLSPELLSFGWYTRDKLPDTLPYVPKAMDIARSRHLIPPNMT